MSKIVEERVTEMRFDNRYFEQAVNQSLKTIDKLKEALNFQGVGKGLENINVSGENIKNTLGGAVETVRNRFGALDIAAGVVLGNIATAAVSAGTQLVKSLAIDPIMDGFREYETQLNAVQTILANTQSKGSTLDDVNNALSELNKYADLTIYNFTEMTRNIGTFTAAGVDLQTSVDSIKGIANLAAVSGSTSQQASAAMYQLSQALAAGKVQLMDWNSVVNAGMGGEVFQNALIRTSELLGTGAKAAIAAEGSFRESLTKHGWLTTEVLTETLKQISGAYTEADLLAKGFSESQAKEIMQLADTAVNAATKVKTFTQLMDTVKEAVGSGWAQTWQIIIGDFEEAKELWTGISDVLTGFIGRMSDARNSMLQAWKDAGGRTALLNGLKNVIQGIVNLVKPFTDAIRAMIPKVTGEQVAALCKGFERLTSFFKVSEKTSQNLSKVLVALASPFKVVNFVVGEAIKLFVTLITVISKPVITLFQSIIVTIINMSSAIVDFVTNLGNAIKSTNIYMKAFEALNNYIKPMISTLVTFLTKGYNKVVDALYSIRNIGKEDITGFLNFIKVQLEPLSFIGDYIQNGVNKLIEVLGPIGGKLKTAFFVLSNAITNGTSSHGYQVMLTYAESLHSSFISFVEYAKSIGSIFTQKSVFTMIGDYFNSNFGPEIQTASEYINRTMDILKGAFSKVKDVSIEKFTYLVDRFKEASDKLSGVGTIINNGIKSFVKSLSTAKDNIKSSAEGFRDAISTVANLIDPDKFLKFITGGALVGILWKLKSMVDGFIDLIKGKELKNSFIDVLNTLGDTLDAYQKNLKADRLVKIAAAIGILSGALLLIAQIDSDKIIPAVGAMAAIMSELAVLMFAFDKIGNDKGIISSAKMIGTMIGMSTALLILSGVFVKMANLDWQTMAKGGVAIAVMCASLVISANSISKEATQMKKAALGLITFATALRSMVKVVSGLGSLDTDVLTKGLVGIGVLCTELALFMKVANLDGMGMMKGLGLILFASSLLILASAVKKFSELNFGALIKGLISIVAYVRMIQQVPGLISTATGLTILGAALLVMVKAIKKFDELNGIQIAKGLISIAGALTLISLAMRLLPNGTLAKSLGVSILLGQLVRLGKAIEEMGNMNLAQICKGLLTLAGSLLIVGMATTMLNGSVSGAVSLVVVTVALNMLAGVLEKFGNIPLSTIGVGLLAMAGVFTVLGVAGLLLAPVVPVLLGLSGAIALLGVGSLALGGGLLLLSTGLAALAASGAAGFAVLVNGLKGFLELIPLLAVKMAEGLIGLAQVIIANMPVITELMISLGKAMITTLIALIPMAVAGIISLITALLETLQEHLPDFVQAGCDLLISFLNGIEDNMESIVEAGIGVVIAFINGVANRIDELIEAGMNLVFEFIGGIIRGFGTNMPKLITTVSDAFCDVAEAGKNALLDQVGSFIQVGADLIGGLIDGIWSGVSGVVSAIVDVAKRAISAGEEELDINSPSRVFKKMGMYCDEGLAQGISKYAGRVTDATSDLGKDTIDELRRVLSNIDFDDPDSDGPTIRPVLDLTDVNNGVDQMNGLFKNQRLAVGLAGVGDLSTNNINAIKNSKIGLQNDNSDIVTAIKDLNKTMKNNPGGNSYNVNGVTYDDGSNVANAIGTLVRAAKIRRRT